MPVICKGITLVYMGRFDPLAMPLPLARLNASSSRAHGHHVLNQMCPQSV